METRMLYENEIPAAAETARGIFEHCVKEKIADPQIIRYTEEYLQTEQLLGLIRQSQLYMWGTFDAGQIVAVGGLQREGHITMLYVFPYYQKQGLARTIASEMKKYADKFLHLKRITVNAMPVEAAGYFETLGYSRMDTKGNGTNGFVSLSLPTQGKCDYPVKHIKERTLIGIIVGFLAAIFVIAIGFVLSCL